MASAATGKAACHLEERSEDRREERERAHRARDSILGLAASKPIRIGCEQTEQPLLRSGWHITPLDILEVRHHRRAPVVRLEEPLCRKSQARSTCSRARLI